MTEEQKTDVENAIKSVNIDFDKVAEEMNKDITEQKEELKQKAKEWRKNYIPMGITCIERDGVVIETQSKATRRIENPNPFRIKDGWYELYLRDLDNAYIAGATENGIQWHDLRKDPNDLPKDDRDVINERGMTVWCKEGVWYEGFIAMKIRTYPIAWCEKPQFKE